MLAGRAVWCLLTIYMLGLWEWFCNCTFPNFNSCSDGRLNDVKQLVRDGCDPTKVYDQDGKSLLHLAAE